MQKEYVSMAVIRRMPKYYRYLDDLYQNGVTRISSRSLAECMGLTASQIRQDFNCFGGFGQQGYGYNVESLRGEIASIIGVDQKINAALFGVGNIGHALLNNFDFAKCGFTMCAAFDTNPDLIGTKVNGIPVFGMEKLAEIHRATPLKIAILTLPKGPAPALAEQLAEMGIHGIWNFTNVDLQLKNHDVILEDVHFADSLMTLRCRIAD